ncbi:MAG: carboxypeptidase regulatory-like domain-containing protein, partial [Planctomycetaceae bacterium]|nr:carboxypeptidase regulatory-like domain-containing protein [Planctomycetaceae bacterium]
ISVTSTWTNTTDKEQTLILEDDLRADGGKEDMVRSPNDVHDLYYFHDIYWQQAYGFRADGYRIRSNSNSRDGVLTYEPTDGTSLKLNPGGTYSLVRQIIVGRDLPEVLAVHDELSGKPRSPATHLKITDANGIPVVGARVAIQSAAGSRGTTVSDRVGKIHPRLSPGDYRLTVEYAGLKISENDGRPFAMSSGETRQDLKFDQLKLGRATVSVTDDAGRSLPAKVEFIGSGDTKSPNWGPETAEFFVKNLAYTASGHVETPLAAGQYDIIISHGPEHDAVFTKLTVVAGQTATISAVLKHSVATPGWVSSDFHSHSSPSGDNTGSQKGRVLNLAAENIEFAPCTEHNRISTYDAHIQELGLKPFLATVEGMELTGKPLPLNHQNTFPLKFTPRTQDGGAPVTDDSPETQIERIALWDDRSEKLIQQNHPDIGWLFYDKDGDGKPDEGYARSFGLMDVMEIHPIDTALELQPLDMRDGKPFGNNRVFNWLQLLNQGFRIYGVVNTDAHYNFHGSGWLRNWIQSPTDNPAEVQYMEMVRASEQGRLIMSNGPYPEVTFTAVDSKQTVVSGQELTARSGKVDVHVRVQCPNWFDIDTVQILVNGRTSAELTFTRTQHPKMFAHGVVKFDNIIPVTLKEDSHLIVVTGHRTEVLGDVMGPFGGAQHPAAMTNPAFVDLDGNGFLPNKDTLGHPLPVKFTEPK